MPTWEQLQPYLEELAKGLGTTASNLWAILVHRQVIAGYQDLLWATLWSLAYLLPFLVGRSIAAYARVQRAIDAGWDGSDAEACKWTLYVGGAAAAVALAAWSLNAAIGHLAAPEYSALRDLMQMIGKR